MKRRIICLTLIFILCLSFTGTAFAATEGVIVPNGAVGFSSGLTQVSGSSYRPWASASPVLSEDVTVGFTLYKSVGGSWTYVTSGNSSGYGTLVKAQTTVTLSAGSYKLYAWYTGETQSDGVNKYYTIS